MKTVVNKTHGPLRVPLGKGKILHLGPGKQGEISAGALEHGPVKALIDAGDLEVVGDGHHGAVSGGAAGHVHPETHGHHPQVSVTKRGDR